MEPIGVTDEPDGPIIVTQIAHPDEPLVMSKMTPMTQPRYDSAGSAVKAKNANIGIYFEPS
jgi:hypothetical protein